MQEINVVVVGGNHSSVIIDKALLREIKGSMWQKIDLRFAIVMLISLILHSVLMYKLNRMQLQPVEVTLIEKIPERFARLIIEKPIPKETPQKNITDETGTKDNASEVPEKTTPETTSETKTVERKQAQKAVAVRAAKVEQKMRTVGVLGMLTGVGSTTRGPAVIDVLGSNHRKKEQFQNLEKELSNMSGLQQTDNINVMNTKLVRSKDVSLSHKENIDDLVQSIGAAKATTFAKKGDFVIQKPESIEGAASSNAKRDNNAINKVVASNKTSIRMSYEKYLMRVPDLAGKITVRFTISATGTVTEISILENTTGNGDLEKDIIRKIKMWRFDAIAEGDVSVTYPFVFHPS